MQCRITVDLLSTQTRRCYYFTCFRGSFTVEHFGQSTGYSSQSFSSCSCRAQSRTIEVALTKQDKSYTLIPSLSIRCLVIHIRKQS